MKLNDNYRVRIDDRNVVLEKFCESREKTVKLNKGVKDSPMIGTGEFTKATWETLGYFPTHQAALRAFVGCELREVPQEVNEILSKIDGLYALIEGLPINYVYQCNCRKPKEEDEGND